MDEKINPQQPQDQNLNLLYTSQLSGWANFVAVMNIIFGAFSCLGIITAIIGIPMIIAAVKLLGAVESMKEFAKTKEPHKFAKTIENLNSYFIINGVLIIIGIVSYIIMLIIFFAVMATMPAAFGDGF